MHCFEMFCIFSPFLICIHVLKYSKYWNSASYVIVYRKNKIPGLRAYIFYKIYTQSKEMLICMCGACMRNIYRMQYIVYEYMSTYQPHMFIANTTFLSILCACNILNIQTRKQLDMRTLTDDCIQFYLLTT